MATTSEETRAEILFDHLERRWGFAPILTLPSSPPSDPQPLASETTTTNEPTKPPPPTLTFRSTALAQRTHALHALPAEPAKPLANKRALAYALTARGVRDGALLERAWAAWWPRREQVEGKLPNTLLECFAAGLVMVAQGGDGSGGGSGEEVLRVGEQEEKGVGVQMQALVEAHEVLVQRLAELGPDMVPAKVGSGGGREAGKYAVPERCKRCFLVVEKGWETGGVTFVCERSLAGAVDIGREGWEDVAGGKWCLRKGVSVEAAIAAVMTESGE